MNLPWDSQLQCIRRALALWDRLRLQTGGAPVPHPGVLQWWMRNPETAGARSWRFDEDDDGNDRAFAIAEGGHITVELGPGAAQPDLVAEELLRWGEERLCGRARRQGKSTVLLTSNAGEGDGARLRVLERLGYRRCPWHYVKMVHPAGRPVRGPELPARYRFGCVAGIAQARRRAALHRASFHPYSSMTTRQYARVMRMPAYDPALDVLAIGPGGHWVGGALFWFDEATGSGLLEPLGVRPAFRRRGVARALVRRGLAQLAATECGDVHVSAIHPGAGRAGKLPPVFTSSRHLFAQEGFEPTHRELVFRKTVDTHS